MSREKNWREVYARYYQKALVHASIAHVHQKWVIRRDVPKCLLPCSAYPTEIEETWLYSRAP